MCGGALMRILLGLLFFGVHDTSECPLMIQPSTVVVRYGDPVSVNCTVLGYYEGIGWEASEGSVNMVSDVQFVTWSLETLTDWEIRPRCFGNFQTGPDYGFQCEKKLNITVYKPPDSVSISAVNHAGPMLEGEQYQLQCEVQNIAPVQYLTVKWYKGETLENQTSYDALTKTPVNVSSTLLITPIGADDGAQYSCVAELELGPEGPQPPPEVKSDPFNIIVHYTSECPLMIQPSTVVVRYGDPVSVNCTVSGDHEGIGWEASEGAVDMVTEVQFVTWRLETLTDWEIRPKCYGNFLTKAGPDQCDKRLNIAVYKPPDSVSISAVNHTGPMLEGEQYQLQCEVQNIAPVQYLTVKWYKGETLETQTSYDALTKTSVNVSSTLLITPTSTDDGAEYSCVAELELGPEGPQPPPSTKSDPLIITVKFCPLKMEPSTLVVRYGDPVSVNCTVSSVHEGIGWDASEGSVDMVSDLKFVTWSLETLTDWEISPKCFGNFLINGEPDQCAKDLKITVYKPPDSVSISAVNHAGPMLEGEQYQLQCEVQDIAPVQYLTVKWYKGETLENQTSYDALTKTPVNVSSTLLITPTGADDGAQYSCVAELELGPEGPQPPPEVKSDPFNIIVHYTSECPLMIQPSTVVVRYGDPVSVNCTISGDHEGIGWEASEGSVDMVSDVQFVSWSLETLTDWETRPKCFANFQTGPDYLFQCEKKLKITVYKPPDSVSISAVNHAGPMLEGEQYQLQCEVQNIAPVQYLTVKWYKGETLETQTSYDAPTKTPVNVSSTLLITPTSADDGAQYSCVAELELGPEGPQPPPSYKSDPLNITVKFCPLKMEPSTLVVRYGDPVSVNCTLSGVHEGIGWEASEGDVMVTDVQFVTWSLETLTDWEIRPKCFGNFLINGEPDQCAKDLNITVYKPPDSVSISAVNHAGPMLEGEQYQLQCEVQDIAPVQYLTVKWYKGETLENQTYDALTKTPVNVSSTLLITPSRDDDGVQYSCVAVLELGSEGPQPPPSYKSDPLNITVHYKPRITECLGHVKLREGESLDTLVSCRAEGNPSPVVTWYRDQSEFNSFTQLTRRDAGQYVMTAKNTLGSVSVNFTVG